MKHLFLKALILFLALALAGTGCKKELPKCYDPANPDCENYDSCYGVEKPSAAFVMEDGVLTIQSGYHYIADDSIFRGTSIVFRSPYKDTSYKHTWYVGSEVLHDYQFSRNFNKVVRPTTITVHHVLEYPPDTSCFPDDDGIDSVSQTFYLIEYWNELATFGTFRVANENTTDSFDFKIKRLKSDGLPAPYGANGTYSVFVNFNRDHDSVSQGLDYFATNTVGFIEGAGSYPNGKLTVDPETNKVQLELNYHLQNDTIVQKGRKIE